MKKLMVWLPAVVFVLTMFIAEDCPAEEKQYYVPTWIEEIYGTWINEAYTGTRSQKLIIYDWGYGEAFSKAGDTTLRFRWTMAILDKWTDEEGNIWYKTLERSSYGGRAYELYRISNDNRVLENATKTNGFPSEDDLKLKQGGYLIYYRQ